MMHVYICILKIGYIKITAYLFNCIYSLFVIEIIQLLMYQAPNLLILLSIHHHHSSFSRQVKILLFLRVRN